MHALDDFFKQQNSNPLLPYNKIPKKNVEPDNATMGSCWNTNTAT